MDKTARIEIQKQDKGAILEQDERGIWNFKKNEISLNSDPLKFIEDLKKIICRCALARKQGVDFGFATPTFILKFYNDEKKLFFTVKVGSYSTAKETYLQADDVMFLFVKDFPLIS